MNGAPGGGGYPGRPALLSILPEDSQAQEMQTQPVRDPSAPTARADPSPPHTPWLTLARTHTRANAHARSRAPRTPNQPRAPPGAPSPRRPPTRQPLAHLSLHPLPPARTHAHARSPRAGAQAVRGGGRWEGRALEPRAESRVHPALCFRALPPHAKALVFPSAYEPEQLALKTLYSSSSSSSLETPLPSPRAISRSPQQARRVTPQTQPEAALNSSAGAGWRLDFGETPDWGPSLAPPPGSGLIFMF